MTLAAEYAKKYGFDYIAYKPFLTRSPVNHAEVLDFQAMQSYLDEIIAKIKNQFAQAQKHETPNFRVYSTTNLKMLLNKSAQSYMHQPTQCHMQFFRQVLSPLGLFLCPVYRNQDKAKLGDKNSYTNSQKLEQTLSQTAKSILSFNAQEECKEITCLYNHVNWWIEDLIAHPENLDSLQFEGEQDYFF
jgi:hypothetical protein